MGQPLSGPYGPNDKWDLPLGDLKQQASSIRLERTHVEAAVAEVRFVSDRTELDQSVAAAVLDALGSEAYPVFEPTAQFSATVEFTPGGGTVPSQERIDGWLLATSDRATVITLLPSSVVVQTRTYERYSVSLGHPMEKMLAAFTAASGADRIQRLGLRYVNRLTDTAATKPAFWHDHVRTPFAGPLQGELGALVTNTHQQVEFSLDDTAGARVQSGVFEDQGASDELLYSYLIDLDVFREQTSLFDPERCSNELRQLNRTALALFANVLTDQYLTDLGPVPVAPTGTEDPTLNAAGTKENT